MYFFSFPYFETEGSYINIRNDIKVKIISSGYTMRQALAMLSSRYGWSDSLSNLSNKLSRETIRYSEILQLAQVLGYDIVWQKHES